MNKWIKIGGNNKNRILLNWNDRIITTSYIILYMYLDQINSKYYFCVTMNCQQAPNKRQWTMKWNVFFFRFLILSKCVIAITWIINNRFNRNESLKISPSINIDNRRYWFSTQSPSHFNSIIFVIVFTSVSFIFLSILNTNNLDSTDSTAVNWIAYQTIVFVGCFVLDPVVLIILHTHNAW